MIWPAMVGCGVDRGHFLHSIRPDRPHQLVRSRRQGSNQRPPSRSRACDLATSAQQKL